MDYTEPQAVLDSRRPHRGDMGRSVGSTEYDDGNIEYHVDFAEQTMLESMTAGELRNFALDVLRAAGRA